MANAWDPTPLGPDTPGMDNKVDYADIVRYNVVSQFQQMMNSQTPMTKQQQYQYLTQSKYRYGTDNDVEMAQRRYNRESQLNRHSYASSTAAVSSSWGAFGVAAAASSAIGLTGVAAFAAPMLAPIIPMSFVNKGLELNMQRQRYMQSAALDLESYRDRIGLSTLSYNQATQLGSRITQSSYKPGQFFNAQEQSEIHKTALSNDMISAKTAGMSKGDMKQYEKNFKDLLDTVQTVVKVLKTTKEGGMSVIKEMQMQGFGTMGQIRNNLVSASAYGGLTGIGTTNMLNIGAAGAAAVQGTPWTSAAGAAMYQSGAAQAGYLAKSGNVGAQRAVAMAGGVAQAGATLAASQMNALTTGSGLKFMAYMMDKGGAINLDRQQRLLSGQVSAREITTAAQNRGVEYGVGGRATFRRDAEKFASDMAENDPIKLAMSTKAYFNAWKAHKGGTLKDQAYVFSNAKAGQFGSRAVAVMEQSLIQPTAYGEMYATRAAVQFSESAITNPPSDLQKAAWRVYGTVGAPAVQLGVNMSQGMQEYSDALGNAKNVLGRGMRGLAGGIFEALSGRGSDAQKYGVINTGRGVGNYKSNFLRAYGVGTDITTERVQASATLAAQGALKNSTVSADQNILKNWDAESALSKMTRKDIQYVTQTLQSGLMGGRTGEIYKDPQMRRLLELDRGGSAFKSTQDNAAAASFAFLQKINKETKSNMSKASSEMAAWDNFAKESGNVGLARSVMVNLRQGAETNINKWAKEDVSTYANDTNPANAKRRAQILASKSILAEREYKKNVGLGEGGPLGAAAYETKEREFNLKVQKSLGYLPDYTVDKKFRTEKRSEFEMKIVRKGMQERFKRVFGGADVMTAEGALNVMDQLENIDGKGKKFSESDLRSVHLGTDGQRTAFINKREYFTKIAKEAKALKDNKTIAGALSRMELSDYKGQAQNLKDWYYGTADMTKETKIAASALFGMDIKDVESAVAKGERWKIATAALNSQDVAGVNDRKKVLKEQIDLLSNMKYGASVTIKNGKGEDETIKQGDRSKYELEKRKAELADLTAKDIVSQDRDPALSRGVNAYVNPPVLNYWNNQWIL
jgi:hypothetical protein